MHHIMHTQASLDFEHHNHARALLGYSNSEQQHQKSLHLTEFVDWKVCCTSRSYSTAVNTALMQGSKPRTCHDGVTADTEGRLITVCRVGGAEVGSVHWLYNPKSHSLLLRAGKLHSFVALSCFIT